MNLQPLNNKVVIKTTPPEQSTASGIVLMSSNDDAPTVTGTVLAIAENVIDVKVGDTVMFGKYSGQTVKHEGEPFIIMSVNDIIAVVEA